MIVELCKLVGQGLRAKSENIGLILNNNDTMDWCTHLAVRWTKKINISALQ